MGWRDRSCGRDALLREAKMLCRRVGDVPLRERGEDALSGGAVESQPLVAVGEIDDAAVGEASFLQAVTHDGVVAVSVDADVVAVTVAEVEHGIHHAVAFRQARNAVYDQIRLVVEPLAAVDMRVCRVGAGDHRKHGRQLATVLASVAHAPADVGKHHRLVGIAAGPLQHVSAGAHYAPRRVDDFHHRVQVGRQNFAYFHKISIFKMKTADNRAIISRFEYPERDLNPHSRNGQRILSPSCLPFHHSSILKKGKESGKRDSNSRP